MTLITDSSFLVALYDGSEVQHHRAYDFAANSSESILVPDVVLPEVGFLLRRDFGMFHPNHCEYLELLP